MKQIEISEARAAIETIAPRYGVSFAVLFGSQATGRTHAGSDADIAVQADCPLSPLDLAEMAYEIGERIGIETDVVDIRSASPLLQKHASEGILLYEREPHVFARFGMYAFKRFVETKPLRDLRRASLDAFLAAPAV
ncbi:nucleotidyltransferase domain-containing protein [Candidatus Kaiserbacteria bacterium]|nr:nucleotidyltransferase domain-containing protein [Candidatus Kaiserbacteria bacterium]